MSRIFEALHRSESERLGASLPQESAAELLQTAEMLELEPRPSQTLTTTEPQVADVQQFPRLTLTPPAASRLICLTQPGSLGAEKVRVLALRLKHQREKRKLKKVLITSTMPEEGKSLISANLAITLARSKHLKTLLMECDLRRPTLSQVLTGRTLAGLSEYLQGSLQLSEAMYETAPSGFYFLPAGFPPVNPLELMQSVKFQKLMEHFSSTFDWILIDSPPVMPLADTSLLMRICDGILMVAREGVTEKKLLQKAAEMIDPSRLLGIVLNSSSNSDHENYYQRYSVGPDGTPEGTSAQ